MENIDKRIFDTVFELWSSRAAMLNNRRRLKRYTYGDQWGDIVRMPDGTQIVESQWITQSGRRPVTNNLIRRLVRAIVGRYRDMARINGWYTGHSEDAEVTELEELDSRLFEEFLISGMAIQRVADDNPLEKGKVDIVNVSPENFFCNEFRDTRGRDIDVVGMLHDMSVAEVAIRFGAEVRNDTVGDVSAAGNPSFFTPLRGRVRVIEVWTRQYDGGNLSWWVRWYDTSGRLLDSYPSRWAHGSHPFVVKFYPLTDGEVHSFVEDVVDQQRYINRLIVLIDRILATSAKGVLLFPLNQKIDTMSWKDVSQRWASTDGVLPINGGGYELPQQVGGGSGDAGVYRLLEMELKLFDETAGVGPALLGGNNASSGVTGVEHYQAQVENATIALSDVLRSFRHLVVSRDAKMSAVYNS